MRTTSDIVKIWGNFPGCPVVKTALPVQGVACSIPGQGIKIPHALWYGQKKKKFFFFASAVKYYLEIEEKKENVS